jgi:prolyl-tRNA editing enzyme YbaK/EbsC (Cys-tRNA(Pro) deacylase)
MSIERARAYLAERGYAERIVEFETSSATVELAAKAAGTTPARIAKSLSFLIDGHAVLVVCAGDARVDNHRFKIAFHTKPKMLSRDMVGELVGHAVGGVCPFGVNDSVEVYLDESLRRFETVFPAAGSSNSAIELTLDELEELAEPVAWVDVCRDWPREDEEEA